MGVRLQQVAWFALAGFVSTACDVSKPLETARVGPAADVTGTTSGLLVLTSSVTLTADHYGTISIEADNVTLDCAGHSIFGPGTPGYSGGINIGYLRRGDAVKRCTVTGFDVNGIFAGGSSDGRYENNIIYGNAANGIHLDHGDNNVVVGNTSRSSRGIGIVITNATRSRIEHNTAEENTVGAGVAVMDNSHDNVVLDNVATGNSIGFLLENAATSNEFRRNVATNNEGTQFLLIRGASNNLLDSNNAVGGVYGAALLEGSNDNVVTHNRSTANTVGFALYGSVGNQIRANTAIATVEGFVFVSHADNNVVEDNDAGKNEVGFEFSEGSGGNTITHNVANNNTTHGFVFFQAHHNTTRRNTGNNNGTFGFLAAGGATFNELARNTANNNKISGFYLADISSNNTLALNVARSNEFFDAVDEGLGTGNVWDGNRFGTTLGIGENNARSVPLGNELGTFGSARSRLLQTYLTRLRIPLRD